MNPTFRLVLKSGPNSGQTCELGTTDTIIGRDINANFVINDPEVSRRHARLYLQGANYVIEDLGSTNGTVVNGQRLAGPYILSPGEQITLGEHTQVLFEKVILDPDATLASLRPIEPVSQPEPLPSVVPAQAESIYEPVTTAKEPVSTLDEEFVGRVPEKPRAGKPARKKKTSSLVVILIVVVVVLACGCIAFAIFDALDLYCEIPGVMNLLIPGACPP
ncbi:MAG: FHA domain-containing protein [Bellilinea sp.]